MSTNPTKDASGATYQAVGGGDDFLQFKGSGGEYRSWIDGNGFGQGNLATSNTPPSNFLWVDTTRTDAYTPTGSGSRPFKTIQAAVNQVAANSDNS